MILQSTERKSIFVAQKITEKKKALGNRVIMLFHRDRAQQNQDWATEPLVGKIKINHPQESNFIATHSYSVVCATGLTGAH